MLKHAVVHKYCMYLGLKYEKHILACVSFKLKIEHYAVSRT